MNTRITMLILCVLAASCSTEPADMSFRLEPSSEETFPEKNLKKNTKLERPFPKKAFYKLLVAEFALRRRVYSIALSSYLEQAAILRDAGISAHTTKIAIFLRKNKAATESAQLWIQLDPNNPEANLALGELLIASGLPIDAIPYLELAATVGIDVNFPALVEQYDELGKEQKSQFEKRLNDLRNRLPRNANLLLALAILNNSNDRVGESVDLLSDLLEINPKHRRAIILKSAIQLAEGLPDPLNEIKKALKLDPKDSKLRLEYAKLLTKYDLNEARTQFETLSAASPRNSELLVSLALINQETGDTIAAKAYLQELIKIGKKTSEARAILGRIAETENDFQEALKHYLLISDSPEFLFANLRIGKILLRTNAASQFNAHFNNMRRVYPHHGEKLFSIEADILNKAELFDKSLEVFSRGISLYPESLNLRYNRSIIAEILNDLTLVENDLRSIISSDPLNATALNALGYTLANKTDRLEEAYELISRALKLQPNEPAILDSMGWVLYRQKHYKQALDFLRRAYKLLPDPEVAAHIGEVLWVLGKVEAAREIWDEASKRSPNHKILKNTLRRLEVGDAQLDL